MPGMFTLSNPLEPDDSLHRVKMLLHVFHCIRADSHGGTLSRPDGHEVVTCAFDSRVKRECIHMQAHTRVFSVVARGHLAISSDLLASPKFRCFDFFHFEERLQTTVSCAAFTEFDFFKFLFRHGRENNDRCSPLLRVSFIHRVLCLPCSETTTSYS